VLPFIAWGSQTLCYGAPCSSALHVLTAFWRHTPTESSGRKIQREARLTVAVWAADACCSRHAHLSKFMLSGLHLLAHAGRPAAGGGGPQAPPAGGCRLLGAERTGGPGRRRLCTHAAVAGGGGREGRRSRGRRPAGGAQQQRETLGFCRGPRNSIEPSRAANPEGGLRHRGGRAGEGTQRRRRQALRGVELQQTLHGPERSKP
jgi:hypothetical protein